MKKLYLLLIYLQYVITKVAIGDITTLEYGWEYIDRFVYSMKKVGTMTVQITGDISDTNILIYSDLDEWERVYMTPFLEWDKELCEWKTNMARMILPLTDYNKTKNKALIDINVLNSARPRWWYVAISHCNNTNFNGISSIFKDFHRFS